MSGDDATARQTKCECGGTALPWGVEQKMRCVRCGNIQGSEKPMSDDEVVACDCEECEPCPCCKSKDVLTCKNTMTVECGDCGLTAYGENHLSEAIAIWNTRPKPAEGDTQELERFADWMTERIADQAHGCLTGDCPHDHRDDCNRSLVDSFRSWASPPPGDADGGKPSTKCECVWRDDPDGQYETDCGQVFILNHGTPADNDMRHCCYCGKPLVDLTAGGEGE